MTSPAELLLVEMRDKVDGQLATLESARTRAGIAISASGVVAGLFAQHLKHPIILWDWGALVALLVGAVPAVWILWPHKMTMSPKFSSWTDWAKEHDQFVRGNLGHPDAYLEATPELGAIQLALTMLDSMQDWYEDNGPLLSKVHICVAIAFVGVVAQMICWVLAVLT